MSNTRYYLVLRDGTQHVIRGNSAAIECFRCGVCCTKYQPRVNEEEAKAIADFLGVPPRDFLLHYTVRTNVGYLLRQTSNGCIFLTWEQEGNRASCAIYPCRPKACREWSASLSNVECREGLCKVGTPGRPLLLPKELYFSNRAVEKLTEALRSVERTE